MSTQKYAWPQWMPSPQASGYGYGPTDRRVKTEMEIGGIYRVEFDTDETTLNCTVMLDQDELAFLEGFERHVLKQGTLWFDMDIYVAGVISTHTVRFKDRPKMGNVQGAYTTVTMALDVAERNTLDTESTMLLYELGPDVLYASSRLHEVLHVNAPGVTILPAA